MKRSTQLACLFLLLLTAFAPRARATDATDAFDAKLQLDPIRRMSLQHHQTIKTFDTYARETLFTITGKSSLNGRAATPALLDMAFNPGNYASQNLIYIHNKPFRKDITNLPMLDAAEKLRIVEKGTVSLDFWMRPDVQRGLEKIVAQAVVKIQAVQQINGQATALAEVLDYPKFRGTLISQAIVPPIEARGANEKPWATLEDASMHVLSQAQSDAEHDSHGEVPKVFVDSLSTMVESVQELGTAWRAQDATAVNAAAAKLAQGAADANPSVYPSLAKRKFEVFYNSFYRLTLPGAALYFGGFVFFLLAWRSEMRWMYRTAILLTVVGWLVHATGIGVRWWLVEKNVGNWFESIPIKNQFESVLMSAFFGVTVAMALEAWKRKGIFGAAASAVGVLSLVAIFSAPYFTGRDIGGDIKQNAGILMTYWLYIHVVLVTASYALIGMTFVMGVWYLISYLASPDSAVLKTLDQCNLVMLQLAFIVLGVGIITGAMWADKSWGRPWGWDPKETFALITWIVYLIIIHVRFITSGTNRGLVTSSLSVVGFFVMLFNWIGVNFFLVGLHSYALLGF